MNADPLGSHDERIPPLPTVAAPPAAASGPRARQENRPVRDRVVLAVGGWAIYSVLKLLGWTTRKRYVGADELFRRFAAGEQVILSFWHGRLVMMPFAYRGRGACIMNSRHRDGELISRVIRRFGIEVVYGSSTRGWVGGLKGLLAAHAKGKDLVVVPDGPRGPRCRAKSGIIQLARATGAPIYPAACGASRARTLTGSWDWLSIPLPLARVVYVVGEPLRVGACPGRGRGRGPAHAADQPRRGSYLRFGHALSRRA